MLHWKRLTRHELFTKTWTSEFTAPTFKQGLLHIMLTHEKPGLSPPRGHQHDISSVNIPCILQVPSQIPVFETKTKGTYQTKKAKNRVVLFKVSIMSKTTTYQVCLAPKLMTSSWHQLCKYSLYIACTTFQATVSHKDRQATQKRRKTCAKHVQS
jgi:hypothetical protein